MDVSEPPPFLREPIARLARAFSPERIVLFGSYAKGRARPGSDVDLLVIADIDDDRSRHLRRARQICAPAFPPIDVSFCTPAEAADAHAARSPFLFSILGTGVTVYRRSR